MTNPGALALTRKQPQATVRPALSQVGQSTKRKAAAVKLMRRVHLYSGLALLPWVLVYGISGFLFNHGGSASTAQRLPVEAQQLAMLAPDEDALGERLMSAMDEAPSAKAATLSGSWSFEFTSPDEKRYRLSVPIDGSDASYSERTVRSSSSSNIPSDTFAAEREAAEAAAAALLERSGVAHASLRMTGGPSLRVRGEERRWFTTLTRDRVSESQISPFDFSRLMRRLHVTHGYSRPDTSRVVWAVFVDIMAFAMVMWSITGVVMWWQMKRLRAIGGVVIAAAFGGGVLLILGLQAQFNS
ncbi:MAG: hypothetical protein CMJ88_14780 [Planctomycetes bacterium]|nr:hypothetical protein [Planctomycetota bacterium]